MEVLDVLARCGGVADARTLVAFSGRRQLSAAVASGQVVRDGRGRYALPTADQARRAAHRLTALVSGLSAATAHGWEVKWPPIRPQLTVPAKRRVTAARRDGVDLRWRDVPDHDVWDGVLRPGPTVIDCARTLPFDEALAVADSALRHGAVTAAELARHADRVRTTGRRAALRHDCERYTALVLLGWRVVRFAWEHVMFAPEYVAGCLRLLADPAGRTDGQVTLPRPALVRP